MTMNWYVAESLMSERNTQFARADSRRWPEVDHARRMRSAREPRPIPPRPLRRNPPTAVGVDLWHRVGHALHGLVAGHPVAQR
jgi:hypothetical protein